MSIAAFGIVNKLNEPLYLLADCKSTASRTGSSSEETDQNEDDPSEVVNRHAIVFTALDAIEARRTKSSRASGPAGQLGESFLGLLFSIGTCLQPNPHPSHIPIYYFNLTGMKRITAYMDQFRIRLQRWYFSWRQALH